MTLRGRLDARGQLRLMEFESTHPRGHWIDSDERSYYTHDEPRRYRKFTHRQLVERGDVPQLGPLAEDAGDQLRQEMQPIAEAGFPQLAVRTRRTYLGRAREYKQRDWHAGVERIAEAMERAGLDDDEIAEYVHRWAELDTLRIEDDGRDVRIYDGETLLFDEDPQRLERAAIAAADAIRREAEAIQDEIQTQLLRRGKELIGEPMSWEDLGISESDLNEQIDDDPAEAYERLNELYQDLDERIDQAAVEGLF